MVRAGARSFDPARRAATAAALPSPLSFGVCDAVKGERAFPLSPPEAVRSVSPSFLASLVQDAHESVGASAPAPVGDPPPAARLPPTLPRFATRQGSGSADPLREPEERKQMEHDIPTNAALVTGATYPLRRELRSLGCLWNRDREGYLIAEEKAECALAYALDVGLSVDHIVFEPEDLEPLTGDALRAYRQDRQTSRADRLRIRADAADRRADEARNRVSEHERDFLRLGEPIKVGHHSEGRHRKLIARFDKAFDAEMTERSTAT